MSPRTQLVHVVENGTGLRDVSGIIHKRRGLVPHALPGAQSHRIEESLPNRSGYRRAVGRQFTECTLARLISAEIDDGHGSSVRHQSYASRVISTVTKSVEPNGPA